MYPVADGVHHVGCLQDQESTLLQRRAGLRHMLLHGALRRQRLPKRHPLLNL